jgi:hypothetical protein
VRGRENPVDEPRRRAVLFTRAPRRALTLAELLLALAGAAVVGAAVATALFAVASGTQTDQDQRSLVGRRNALAARHAGAIRSARRILAHSPTALVMWMADENDSGAPDLSEIQSLEFDGHGQLIPYRAPAGLSPADDQPYALSDDFLGIAAALRGTPNWQSRPWARDVVAWATTLNHPAPQQANLVLYRATLGAGSQEEILCGAQMLRN